eukprot:gb/GEZN01008551.1/.p1 GENE.gb/GEZN01008551.1/~~gb/GEZN01008551.1/.p1  ORF type:complete len:467 (+),score=41.44 gb/GEZN01008551.1/:47-1402(+)
MGSYQCSQKAFAWYDASIEAVRVSCAGPSYTWCNGSKYAWQLKHSGLLMQRKEALPLLVMNQTIKPNCTEVVDQSAVVKPPLGAQVMEFQCGSLRNLLFIPPTPLSSPKPFSLSESRNHTSEEEKFSLTIFMIDAVSRQNFIRKAKRTIRLLQGSSFPFHDLFHFSLYMPTGWSTGGTFDPMVVGQPCPPEGEVDPGGSELWTVFGEAGYRTVVGFNDCRYKCWLTQENYIKPHHTVGFGCHDQKYDHNGQWSNFQGPTRLGAKCIAQYPPGAHFFNYSRDLLQQHQRGGPVLQLFHIIDAHEGSSEAIASLDDEMARYLELVASQEVSSGLHRSVLVFMSDHGLHMTSARLFSQTMLEHKFPLLFMLVPKALSAKYGTNLRANQEKVISAVDLRKSFAALADPEWASLSLPGEDLFRTVLRADRTCEEANIPEGYCMCDATRVKLTAKGK